MEEIKRQHFQEATAVSQPIRDSLTADLALGVLYATTLAVSAFLLFSAEPLVGKALLPYLGGSPAVWNTCLVFYQMVLLVGYLYAHFMGRFPLIMQLSSHFLVLTLGFLCLPFLEYLPARLTQVNPNFPEPALLAALLMTAALPLGALSASAPLLQSWFSRRRAEKTYGLYAASNLGSLLALLAYPFWIERHWSLTHQDALWKTSYLALALLVLLSGISLWLMTPAERQDPEEKVLEWLANRDFSMTTRRYFWWIALAFVPTSLLYSVTMFITADLAAIPLFWTIPLALYFLAYVLAFSPRLIKYLAPAKKFLWLAVLAGIGAIATDFIEHIFVTIGLLCGSFFFISIICNVQLVETKPNPKHLTAFYLAIAIGGILGGLFNTFIAPAIFKEIYELPLMFVLAMVVVFPPMSLPKITWRGLVNDTGTLGLLFLAVCGIAFLASEYYGGVTVLATKWSMEIDTLYDTLRVVLPLLILCWWLRRRLFFSVGCLCVFVALVIVMKRTVTVYKHRDRYGILEVNYYSDPFKHALVNGRILHGEQVFEPDEVRYEPNTYYHRKGPLGQVIDEMNFKTKEPNIAAIGLGAGTIAAYGTADNHIDFYELNPAVTKIARNADLFTWLSDCEYRKCDVNVIHGDGRLNIAKSNKKYDLIVLDAFSSEAIPIHLLTLEAVKTYLENLAPHGMLAFHVSNRFVNLLPVIANICAELNLSAGEQNDPGDKSEHRGASHWVAVARETADFGTLATDKRWSMMEMSYDVGVWTDDFADLLSVVQF